MGKMIQLRNVSPEMHAELRRRAAADGRSMSDYIIGLLQEHVRKPTLQEWLRRIEARGPIDVEYDSTELKREARKELGWSDE